MKAAVLREVGKPLQIETVAISKPGPREVLIRTAAAGLCHSDLHFIEGTFPHPLPVVLGHESAGIVEQVGSAVRHIRPGDHVVTCLTAYCGHCEHCVTGHLNLCQSPDVLREREEPPRLAQLAGDTMGQFLNLSSFAEQMLVHENACVVIARDMPLDRAALLGCAVTTGVGAVLQTSRVRAGETVAVIGCGGVGLSAVNGAAIAGASRIIAIDLSPSKKDLARQFGATDFIDSADGDPVEAVLELTKGGVHHSFEAIGLPATVSQAFRMLRAGGTANVIGLVSPGTMISIEGFFLLRERRLQGSFMGSTRFPADLPRLVDFYMSGKLNLDALISRRIPLEQINEGFAEMKTGVLARSVIVFDS